MTYNALLQRPEQAPTRTARPALHGPAARPTRTLHGFTDQTTPRFGAAEQNAINPTSVPPEARTPLTQRRGQSEITIGAPSDPLERNADRIAAEVISSISRNVPGPDAMDGAPNARAGILRREAAAGGGAEVRSGFRAPLGFTRALRHEQACGGHSLDPALRIPMERAFASDFSKVQLHDDGRATRLTQQIQARAFAIGNDVFFARGALKARGQEGQWLLAHELAHVVQQRQPFGTTIRRSMAITTRAGDTTGGAAPFAAGETITKEELEETVTGARRLAPGTVGKRLARDGSKYFVVPLSAVRRNVHGDYDFRGETNEGREWAAKFDAANEKRKTALGAQRIGDGSRDILVTSLLLGGVGGVALGSGLLSAGLMKLAAAAPALFAGGSAFFDSDPANTPGPGDPTYAAKHPAQRAAEAALFSLPLARLMQGGATMAKMMLWGGGSALATQAVQDLGNGQISPGNVYAGHGLGGALGWGLPVGPFNALARGVRGMPLFANFGGYGLATGIGLRGSHDLAAGQPSGLEDYALSGGLGLGLGLLGAPLLSNPGGARVASDLAKTGYALPKPSLRGRAGRAPPPIVRAQAEHLRPAPDIFAVASARNYTENGKFLEWNDFKASDLPIQTYKQHISATVDNATDVAQIILPELRRLGVPHKIFKSKAEYAAEIGKGQAGKFITIYPRTPKEARVVRMVTGRKLRANKMYGPSSFIPVAGEASMGMSGGVSTRYGANVRIHYSGDEEGYGIFMTNELGEAVNKAGMPVLYRGKPINLSEPIKKEDYENVINLLYRDGVIELDKRGRVRPTWAPPLE